jgi:predicted nucleic acid-binding protein
MLSFPQPRSRRRVLVDSSANLALLNRRDRNHEAAKAIQEWLIDQHYRPYTTNVMLIESHALTLSVLGGPHANRFLRAAMQSALVVVRVRASDESRARRILDQYDDKSFSYNDAISFSVMERLEIDLAFTFDSDFRQYGVNVVMPPFRA